MKKLTFLLFFSVFCTMPLSSLAYSFGTDLYPDLEHPDVLQLQRFLNASPQTVVSNFGAGSPGYETMYYGERTRAALYRFQTLPQYAIAERDGIFRGATRAAVNQLSQTQMQLNVSTVPIPSGQTSAGTGSSGLDGYGLGGYGLGGFGLSGGQTTARVTGPVISQLSPNRGAAGTQVLLTGTGFQPTNNYVLFQDRSIGPLFSNGSTLSFVVPSTGNCGGNVPCSVLVANSTGTSQAAARFILDQPLVPPLPSGIAAVGSGSITNFSVTPAVVVPKDPVKLVFAGTESIKSYRVRIDCPKDVAAASDLSIELCRSTNVLKTSASPVTIRFANSTGREQTATLTLTAHDARGAILDSKTQEVVVRPVASTVQTTNTPGSPFRLAIDGVLDDGSSVIPLTQGSALVKNILISGGEVGSATYSYGYAYGYSTAATLTQPIVLSVSVSGLSNIQATISPSVVSPTASQTTQAQLIIIPQGATTGDYRVTITGVSGSYVQTKSFILRIGNTGQSLYQSQAADLVISYVGVSSLTRGQSFSPFFAVRELNNVAFTPTAVRVTLYDFMYNNGFGAYGYRPQLASDQSYAIGTSQLTVSSGYTNSQVYLGGGYTITQPGSYTVCASIDTTNLIQETAKANNIGCGTVQVE